MGAREEGLRAASESLARVMRRVAAVRTHKTADAVNVANEGADSLVRGGHPGGPWGWEPIQGSMFDNNRRHPLFGNKRHWYDQGYFPITEITVSAGATEAAERFADAAVDLYLKEAGI